METNIQSFLKIDFNLSGKTCLIFILILFATGFAQAQQGFVGIQNSTRRGLLHATMNPAEITTMQRKFELNVFSMSANLSNDVFSFSDFLSDEDLVDLLFNRTDEPVNLRTDIGIMGPSFGFRKGKWGFGLTSQAFIRTDVINFDPNLGRSITNSTDGESFFESRLNIPINQRVNLSGWTELGVLAGRELYSDENNRLSFGAGFRLLMPSGFFNAGIDNIRGTLRIDQNGSALTDATGALNFNYSGFLLDESLEDFNLNALSFGRISGVGLDLGFTHEWLKNGVTKATSGISFKGLGALDFGATQVNHNYTFNIPAGERFEVDQLEGNFEEIEAQLLNSGFFTKTSEGDYRPRLPRLFTAYTDLRVSKAFYLSVFGQFNLGDLNKNQQIAAQNIFALTPRLNLGLVELFSPWISTQTAGISGGLGMRVGGFFVGSNSIITGAIGSTKQADIYAGWSLGFGNYNKRSKKDDDF